MSSPLTPQKRKKLENERKKLDTEFYSGKGMERKKELFKITLERDLTKKEDAEYKKLWKRHGYLNKRRMELDIILDGVDPFTGEKVSTANTKKTRKQDKVTKSKPKSLRKKK